MRSPALAALASVLLVSCPLYSQNLDSLGTRFRVTLRLMTDSLIQDQRKYVATLFNSGNTYSYNSSWALRSHLDTILTPGRDSLDVTRENNVRLLNRAQETLMRNVGDPAQAHISSLLAQFEMNLQSLYSRSEPCLLCKTAEDFQNAEAAYETQADSISGYFGDSMATIVDAWESSIDDASTAFSTSLDDTLEVLKEDYAAYLKDHASRLEVDAGYESHASYRGRDNGIAESSLGPTATYYHKTGLYLAGALGWVSQSGSAPDVSSLSAGYAFTASPNLQGSVSYTHFWYSASSPLPQAVTDQEVSGMLSLQSDPLNIEGTILDDFTAGGGSEITIDLELSTDIVVSEQAFGGTLSLSPTATAVWGQQTERLLQKRIVRAKKKEIVRVSGTPYDVFSIMSYGLSLPIDLAVGNFAIVPIVAWTLPVDVLNQRSVLVKDPSSSNSFVSAGLTVSITFY